MSSWRVFPKGQWTPVGKVLSGFGQGEGAYGAAYAIDISAGQFLNGRVSTYVRLAGGPRINGAGVICRADELHSFIAFCIVTDDVAPDRFSVRLAGFKHGKLVSLIGLKESIQVPAGEFHIALQFFSGDMVGQVTIGTETHILKHSFPVLAFPGYAGIIRFYGSSIMAQNIKVEKITMWPILMENKNERSQAPHSFLVFLSHSTSDKEVVLKVLEAFKKAGISYWVDHEQISFGDGIVGKIEEGLQKSKYVVVCLSEHLASSGWCRAEYSPILYREFSGNTSRRVIPLSLDGSKNSDTVPLLLSDKMRADFTSPSSFSTFLQFLREADAK